YAGVGNPKALLFAAGVRLSRGGRRPVGRPIAESRVPAGSWPGAFPASGGLGGVYGATAAAQREQASERASGTVTMLPGLGGRLRSWWGGERRCVHRP